MNHAPLIHSKWTMLMMAVAASCPFAQAGTDGYLSTSSAAGTSQVGPTAVYSDSQAGINAREVARRQATMNEAMQLLQEGRTAYAAGKYKESLEKYQAAWNRMPKAPATRQQQEFIIKSIGDASIAVAIEYSKVGRYDDAEQLLLDVIARDPGNKRARQELSLMRDPVRNNPALTPEHVKNVEEVQRLLTLAYGYYDLGKYDEAYAEFNRVIQIDPYNTAARRGQEQVSKRRMNYYRAAYDSYRAKALAEVDALWEEPLPQSLPDIQVGGGAAAAPATEAQLRNYENLDKIQISQVSFENIPVSDIVNDILNAEARRAGVALNFIYQAPTPVAAAPAPAPSSDDEEEEEEESAAPVAVVQPVQEAVVPKLTLPTTLSAKELLDLVCRLSGCEYRVADIGVIVYQKGSGADMLESRKWQISRAFLVQAAGGADSEDEDEEEEDAFMSGGSSKKGRLDVEAALKSMNVSFPKGASANYNAATRTLSVTNTRDNLDIVEEEIQQYRNDLPQMIKVSAKFVEISQTNEDELSFDWVVNPFSINDAGSAYLGGVNGTGSVPNRTFNDFVTSGGTAYSNNHANSGSWPVSSSSAYSGGTDTITNGLMTGGLRSGTGAISANSLSSLLTRGSAAAATSSGAAPGILSLSGIYDSGSFQMIMRGLSQKKGVDIMSAPSLVAQPKPLEFIPEVDSRATDTSSDEGAAKIEVVRRFIYPVEYDEPQLSDIGGGGETVVLPVAAPANPSTWGVEEVGIVLRFLVDGLEDNDVIKFNRFEIKVVDFEGFINYGSPITGAVSNETMIENVSLTENRIDMPIFSRRYINSNPCIYDGYTIAIGGLIEDQVQKVEDKVPVFGDLPLIGRLFRSNAESHIRKNLTVFVTAEKIDPTGKPTRLRDTGTSEGAASASTAPGLFPDDGLATP